MMDVLFELRKRGVTLFGAHVPMGTSTARDEGSVLPLTLFFLTIEDIVVRLGAVGSDDAPGVMPSSNTNEEQIIRRTRARARSEVVAIRLVSWIWIRCTRISSMAARLKRSVFFFFISMGRKERRSSR